jgi:hypothetical protein
MFSHHQGINEAQKRGVLRMDQDRGIRSHQKRKPHLSSISDEIYVIEDGEDFWNADSEYLNHKGTKAGTNSINV